MKIIRVQSIHQQSRLVTHTARPLCNACHFLSLKCCSRAPHRCKLDIWRGETIGACGNESHACGGNGRNLLLTQNHSKSIYLNSESEPIQFFAYDSTSLSLSCLCNSFLLSLSSARPMGSQLLLVMLVACRVVEQCFWPHGSLRVIPFL